MTDLLFEAVDAWARKEPDARAIHWLDAEGVDASVTYGELRDRSNQIANQLLACGVGHGDRVAICIPKGPDAIAAMVGATKVGAPYVPLDPDSPSARVELVLHAAAPTVLVASAGATDAVQAAIAASDTIQVGTLDGGAPSWPTPPVFSIDDVQGQATTCTPASLDPDDLAHLLFTSGSTGVPKGVMITHRNAMSYVRWTVEHFGYTPDDQVSGHAPLHFDLSTMDIYAAFEAGATLHPVPARASINPAELASFIRDRQLTQWFSVPSALNHLVRFDLIEQDDFPQLERLMWCGEVLPTPTLMGLMERLPHVEFTNLYGPTEATIASSWYRVPAIPADATEDIPIGRPCEGEDLLVLSETGEEVADMEIGDLYIEGVGLSPGYWQDEEKTAAVFRTDLREGQRLYKTGDLARRRSDGEILFVGRADSQVKVRGYRIELGEIEAALGGIDGIDDVAVVAVDRGGFDGWTICAAYVSAEGLQRKQIVPQLTAVIPKYMTPQLWQQLDELPKNVNGKIDRPALRASFDQRS